MRAARSCCPFHDPFDAPPPTDVVAHDGPPAFAELLIGRRIPAITIPAIDRRGAGCTPSLLVAAVDDDVDSLSDDAPPTEQPETMSDRNAPPPAVLGPRPDHCRRSFRQFFRGRRALSYHRWVQ